MTMLVAGSWRRLHLLRAATPFAALLCTLGATRLVSAAVTNGHTLTGLERHVRLGVCAALLAYATYCGIDAVVSALRWRRDIAHEEDSCAVWDGTATYLLPRVYQSRGAHSDRVRVLSVALAAVPVWLAVGAFGLVAGLLVGAVIAMIVALAGNMEMFAELGSREVGDLELRHAAALVRLDRVPADAAINPVFGDVFLARAGVVAGSPAEAVVRRLAAEPTVDGSSRRRLVELVEVAHAIASPAATGAHPTDSTGNPGTP